MEIQPIVIGTAGHIDHGKSTLVKLLTGIDPDRLKEEQERGMTIDLGFAPLELPDGRLVGMVDVPGHERFVRNMVAGATGIDLVVLVVAADDGVMPQTREHLMIMQLLGVERGMIALTKTDKVEPELVDLAEEDVRASVGGTFLEGAPLVRFSARTGSGLDELRAALFRLAAETPPRSPEGIFRMPIQRVFSKRGFGTVVTGIPVSGQARVGDVLEILPHGTRSKIRGLNAYRHETDRIRAGHSSAINFADVEHHAVRRGDVVATPGFYSPLRMVAARVSALPHLTRPLTNRMPVRVHAGTADPHGELVLLDKDEIPPGETGLVQLRLEEPIVCAPGDRFILRLLSPVETLGGGTILEESRHRLKRFKGFVLEDLTRAEASLASPGALLESLLTRHGDELATTEDLAHALKRSVSETGALLAELASQGRVLEARPERWMHADRLETALTELRNAIEAWFREEPHRSVVDVLELRRRTGQDPTLLAVLLEQAAKRGQLETLPGGKVRMRGRSSAVDPALAGLAERVARRFETARFQPPTLEELEVELGVRSADVRRALELLVDAGGLERVGAELYFASGALEEARAAVTENCQRNGHLEIPELRDRLGTTRKYLIPLLEHFDASGVTLRQGGHRVLRRR